TLPRPSTADPSVTTATLLRLMVRRRASSGLAARARLTRATPGVYAIDRSSRLRSGTFERISILPPRCRRNVRSLTLCTETPGIAAIAATSDSACAVSVPAQHPSVAGVDVKRGDYAACLLHSAGDLAHCAAVRRYFEPGSDRVRHTRRHGHVAPAFLRRLPPATLPGNNLRILRSARHRVLFMHGAGYNDKPVDGRRERDAYRIRHDRRHAAAGCPRQAVPAAAQTLAGGADPDPARGAVHRGAVRAAAA